MSDSSPTVKNKFEIEQDGEIFFLVYGSDGAGWISVLYSWVFPALRGRGTANELAQLALVYAKDKHSKVEVFWSGGIPLRFETSRLQATRWN